MVKEITSSKVIKTFMDHIAEYLYCTVTTLVLLKNDGVLQSGLEGGV
jgi:hypothetical protein